MWERLIISNIMKCCVHYEIGRRTCNSIPIVSLINFLIVTNEYECFSYLWREVTILRYASIRVVTRANYMVISNIV